MKTNELAAPPIPGAAVQYLKANPQLADKFDEKYGVGQAQRVLAPEPPRGAGGYAADVGRAAVRGAGKAVKESAEFAVDAFNRVLVDPVRAVAGLPATPRADLEAAARNDLGDAAVDAVTPAAPETLPGRITEGAVQFIGGLVGLGKLSRLAGAEKAVEGLAAAGKTAKIGVAAAKSATVSAVAFDPYDGNVANFVQQFPSLQNPVADFFAAHEDDSASEARLKNALADVVVGVPIDMLLGGLKALRAAKQGRVLDAENHLHALADADAAEAVKATTAEASRTKVTNSATVDALVQDVTGAEGRSASVAQVAAEAPKAPAVLKNPAVVLDDASRADLARTIEDTVMASDASAPKLGDPFDAFFKAKHDFNVDKIIQAGGDGVTTALRIMEDIGEKYRTQIDAARGGEVRSFETVRAAANNMARMTGNDPGQFIAMLTQDAKSMKAVEARLYAYKNFTLSLADSVKRLGQMIDSETHGAEFKNMDEVRGEFARRAEFLANVQAMTKAVQSGTARAVSAGRLGARLSPAMTKAIEAGNFSGVSQMDAAAVKKLARVVISGTPEQVLAASRLSRFDRAGELVTRYWINAILSGPATHIVNATSNFVRGAVQAGEDYLAGVYSGNATQRRVAAQTFAEMAHQTVAAWQLARKALNTGDNILDAKATSRDTQSYRQVSAEALAQAIENGQYAAAIIKAGDALLNYPTRLLGTTDEFFKQVVYRARVTAKAQAEGMEAGLSGTDLQDFVSRKMNAAVDPATGSAYDALGRPLDADALRYAQEATFTQPLTPGKLGASIQALANVNPWMRLVLPFVKTPSNVIADWAYRSGLHAELYRDLAAGGQRRAMAAARLTTGAAFYSVAALLAEQGRVTGMGPQNAETKKLWVNAGYQPYSIKIGDAWVSYNRMDPFGMFFGIAADLADLGRMIPQREADDLAQMALVAFSRNLSNRSYLRSIADVMGALFDGSEGGADRWKRVINSYASGFVPFSGYLNGLKDDPYMREVRSVTDAALNRVPGFSDQLDPQRNILGEITQASDVGGVLPWAIRHEKGDRLGDELVRLLNVTGEKLTRPPKVTGRVDWTSYRNAKGQSAYDRFLELHSELGMRDRLAQAMTLPSYERLSDAGRVEVVRSVANGVRSMARARVLQEFPELRAAWVQYRRDEMLQLIRQPGGDAVAAR